MEKKKKIIIFDIKSILDFHSCNVDSRLAGRRDVPFPALANREINDTPSIGVYP
jgi:hypothetical protein